VFACTQLQQPNASPALGASPLST